MDQLVALTHAIHNVVYAAVNQSVARLSSEEQAAIEDALGSPPDFHSGLLCASCKCSINQHENVGNILAQEVHKALSLQRKVMNVVVRQVSRGAISVVEKPQDAQSFRQITEITSTSHTWAPGPLPGPLPISNLVYPSEVYVHSSLMLRDGRSDLPHFALGVQDLVRDTLHAERAIFNDNPSRLKVVLERKALTASSCDRYNLGMPERGWFFESIIGVVEFSTQR